MRRFGMVAMVCVGFIAGITFVYSCGGSGGNNAVGQPLDASYIRSETLVLSPSVGTQTWTPHSGSESFVVTDIGVSSLFVHEGAYKSGECAVDISTNGLIQYSPGYAINSGPLTHLEHFQSGILFSPGESISVQHRNTADHCAVFLSGYIVAN